MATLKRLGHVAIQVTDIPAALRFYASLGMDVVWQDQDWAYLKAGEDGLALLGPSYKAAGPHFGFVFDNRADVIAAHDRLHNQGVFVGAVHDHRDGTASFYSRDPDGNWFEFLYEPAQAPAEVRADDPAPTSGVTV